MTDRRRWPRKAECLLLASIAAWAWPAAVAEVRASDIETGGPPGCCASVDGYRQGGQTSDSPPRRIERNTLYAHGSSDQQIVTLFDGYLSADSIWAQSESASDDDAAASRVSWSLVNLQLRQEPGTEIPLIRWTGGFTEELISGLETPGHPLVDVLRGARPPREPHEISLAVEITPPDEPTTSGTLRLSQPRDSMGLDLLDRVLYDGTQLEAAFAKVRPAIEDLRSRGGPLEDLTLHAGRIGGERTERSTTGYSTGLIATIEAGGGKTLEVAKVSTFADSRRLRAGSERADFSRSPEEPSCESSVGRSPAGPPPPSGAQCSLMEHEEIQLPSPQSEPPGISGADQGNRDPDDSDSDDEDSGDSTDGTESGAGPTVTSAVPSDSVEAVQQLFPDSAASGAGGQTTDSGATPQQTPGALVPEASVQAGSVAPVSPGSDGGVPLALILGGAGVLLIVGTVARRLRRSP